MDDVPNEGGPDTVPDESNADVSAPSVAPPPEPVPLPPPAPPRPSVPVLTALGQQYLDQTRPWALFLSYMAFGLCAFTMLLGLVMGLIMLAGGLASIGKGEASGIGGILGGAVMGVIYLAIGALHIPPGIFLRRYAKAIEELKSSRRTAALEEVLKHQKSFWRFVGITAVAYLVLMALMVLAGVAILVMGVVMAARS
jgi:hypothetical protein